MEDSNQVALVYFKSEDAYIARHKNEGFIRVDEAENISVIGEHMGHKNVFVVRTPKGEYHLIPESRYVVEPEWDSLWVKDLTNELFVICKDDAEHLTPHMGLL